MTNEKFNHTTISLKHLTSQKTISKASSLPPEKIANGIHMPQANGLSKEPLVTWVHKNFQGILTNETKCLRCETVTARDEIFLDLSLDIEQNSSITSCLKNFSSTETLNVEDKFLCDNCCSTKEDEDQETTAYSSDTFETFQYMEQLGSGPNHGHYASLVKSHNHRHFFDDENVEMIDDSAVQTSFSSA
uniref:USP domain-containing protein n=1 Tax=Lactuca sativa TaxID=4236 RepID=A0A9R1X827_LACSA|nr:hypothetical protein LSAT_V11C500237400 [Lactuca sativa]